MELGPEAKQGERRDSGATGSKGAMASRVVPALINSIIGGCQLNKNAVLLSGADLVQGCEVDSGMP